MDDNDCAFVCRQTILDAHAHTEFIKGWTGILWVVHECDRECWEQDENDARTYYVMRWSEADRDALIAECSSLCDNFVRIAAVYDELDGDPQHNRELISSKELFDVWNTYIRPFETTVDRDLLAEISESIALGQGCTSEESKLLKKYEVDAHADLFRRFQERRGICAYKFIVSAMGLCRLLSLGAPAAIVNAKAKCFAQNMLINRFAVKLIPPGLIRRVKRQIRRQK